MAGKSNIEWTGHTWNPIAGCSVKSPGCKHCYAMPMAARLEAMGQTLYAGLTTPSNAGPVFNGTVRQAGEHALLAPLKRKVPTVYFVNSMSDLFHENVPDEWIDRIFAVMALCPQHTFQVLTKRAARMLDYFSKPVERAGMMIDCSRADRVGDVMLMHHKIESGFKCVAWPLSNVWLGVSAERQNEWDERSEHLRATPAAVSFVSCEPLLGPIRFHPCRHCNHPGNILHWPCPHCKGRRFEIPDWVIVGGESGPGARPMHPDWARSLRDQCAAASVSFFFKQRGEYTWIDDADYDDDRIPELPDNWRERTDDKYVCIRADGSKADGYGGDSAEFLYRVGKKTAGRRLDGIEHNGFPELSRTSPTPLTVTETAGKSEVVG